ncbi:hypothetical protein H6F46_02065 [Limnothrix sp. FACHB-1083]|uniref:hypothetical protein n=1 Tax=unclassified Limnothrix TaxID=2632864 RepID=UPI00168134F7|nr:MULTISPECIES: hypothetical protein [unclassified Limnothrix]MBD2159471.1 hypothetical protein [Limnothrix sp. FACHB-1083]MBD2190173.1 hypothetical protein [Limnothrix sp. FACHB-1088]
MEQNLKDKLDCFLASPYGRTMLGEYAYLHASEWLQQYCEAAGAMANLPDWLLLLLELGQESAEIFASLTDAGTLETDRKTMSLLLERRGPLLAQTSGRLRQTLELHRPGLDLSQDAIEDASLLASTHPPRSGLAVSGRRDNIVNRNHWEPKADFLPHSERRVIGDVGGTPLLLVGYEKNQSRSPMVARATSGNPQQDSLFAVPLSDLLVHSNEPVNIPELELAES